MGAKKFPSQPYYIQGSPDDPTEKNEICFSTSCVSLGERVVVKVKIECVHCLIPPKGRGYNRGSAPKLI